MMSSVSDVIWADHDEHLGGSSFFIMLLSAGDLAVPWQPSCFQMTAFWGVAKALGLI